MRQRPSPIATPCSGVATTLGNIEKHRRPHLVGQTVTDGSWFEGQPEPTVHTGPIELGRVIAEIPYYPEYVPYQSTQPRFGFRPMLIHNGKPHAMPNMLGMIALMVDRVLDVLDRSTLFRLPTENLLEPLRD
jgi:hypothetical protein